MTQRISTRLIAASAALLALGGLAACGDSNRTAGQKVDAAVATTERKVEEIKADIKQGTADAKVTAAEATASAKRLASDATITTSINMALAKDPNLSALKIDVDTRDGRVALSGTAPDAAAKGRATQLAKTISGVTAVDNRLVVR